MICPQTHPILALTSVIIPHCWLPLPSSIPSPLPDALSQLKSLAISHTGLTFAIILPFLALTPSLLSGPLPTTLTALIYLIPYVT